jgi:outer membrane lipoprotein-sorting protein
MLVGTMKTLLLFLALVFPYAVFASGPPSEQEIVTRMAAMNDVRASALRAYQGTRTYQVSYKGFPKGLSAKAVVRLDFTAPDKKQFTIVSEEGSKLLVNRVIRKALESETEAATPEFRKRSALSDANYTFKFVGNDNEGGRPCYLLQVSPKREDKYLYDGRICVDAADFAVVRVDAKPAKNPSFWINSAHIDSRSKKIGEFWLPGSLRSTSHVRLGGDAELNIDYGDYQIPAANAPHSAGNP